MCDIHFTSEYSIEASFSTKFKVISLLVEITIYGYHIQYIPVDVKAILWNANILQTNEYYEFTVGERQMGDEEILHTSKQTLASANRQNHSLEFSIEFDLYITQIRLRVNVRISLSICIKFGAIFFCSHFSLFDCNFFFLFIFV